MKTRLLQCSMLAALVWCCFMINSCKKSESTETTIDSPIVSESDRALPYQYPDWMAGLPDNLTLAQITLPGTHDCAADNHSGGVPSGSHWDAVCQDFRFSNQLLLGVRWFDVRYDNIDKKLHHYDYALSRTLEDIINDAISFLDAHPSETVVFLIKKEYGGSSDATFSDKVWDVLHEFSQDNFYMNDALPTLGEVRGKIIIATHDNTNGNGHIMGPNYSWPSNTSLHFGNTTNFHYYVQDHYSINSVPYDTKSNEIRHLIDLSVGSPDPTRIDLNYTSAERDADFTSIKTVAHNINGNINDYLSENPGWRHCGVLMLNYAGGSDDNLCYYNLVRLIIQHNDFVTTRIGKQTWMGSNLNVTKYRNGDPIPEVTDPDVWNSLTTGAWCYYNNDSTHAVSDGRLYNWYAVNDPRGLAPAGWHVARLGEWDTLVDFLGGADGAGGKLKDIGTAHWFYPNTGATNEVLFTARPAGARWGGGVFGSVAETAEFWTSTASDAYNASCKWMGYTSVSILSQNHRKHYGFSVRCVKD